MEMYIHFSLMKICLKLLIYCNHINVEEECSLADYSRRNRRSSTNRSNDDFNWDEYDRLTSKISSNTTDNNENTYNEEEPSRRRAHQASAAKKRSRLQKQEKKQNKQKNKKLHKKIRLIILSILFICVIIVTGISIGMYAAVSREIKDMNIQNLALNYSSFIYYEDVNGNIKEYEQIRSENNRIWVDSSRISQYLKDALVSIEDERFYKHHGVDIKRTLGATGKFILSKIGIGSSDYGGSTITQQVIKNITNEKDQTPSRKIKEIMRAIAMERQLSKDEILTMYLNIVYFANNCYGVEAASHVYFNKDASQLSLAEAASIVGITQYPAEYDPFVHPDKNIERRNIILKKMLDLGKISEEQYSQAVNSELGVSNSYKSSQQEISSYFADQVVSDVIRDLQTQKGYSEDFATQQVYNGGFKIYATVDKNIQDTMESVFENTSNFPSTGKGGQSAMVIIDPYTGAIKGLVGGLGEKTDIRGWNRATQSKRQPGSAIKPLSVYAPAVDMGKITESTMIVDEEITIGSDNWKPKNSYNDFYGNMTVKEAVARSSNIPAVKVLDMVGLSSSFGYLQNKFHISTLVEKDKNYSSLSLGGLTDGVTVKEMCAAYGCFANSGKYIAPYTYTQVVDSTGQVILQNSSNSSQAISAAAAYITSDLLYGVVNSPQGTGTSAKLNNMPTYGKTGTTDDDYDKWFVGFTPYYVGAVWYGFDNPASISAAGVSGNPALNAWKLVMSKIHSSLPEKELTKPSNVVEKEICTYSGNLATRTCPSTTAYFVEGTQPKTDCNSSHASKGSSSGTKATPKPSSSGTQSSTAPSKDVDNDKTSNNSSNNSSSSGSSTSGGSSSGSSSNESSSGGGSSSGGSSSGESSGGGSSSGESSSGGSSSGGSSSGESSSGGSSSGGSSSSGSSDDEAPDKNLDE